MSNPIQSSLITDLKESNDNRKIFISLQKFNSNLSQESLFHGLFSEDFTYCKKCLESLDIMLLLGNLDISNLDFQIIQRIAELSQIPENYTNYSGVETLKETLVQTSYSFIYNLLQKDSNLIQMIIDSNIISIFIQSIDKINLYPMISDLILLDSSLKFQIFNLDVLHLIFNAITDETVNTDAYCNSISLLSLIIETEIFNIEQNQEIYIHILEKYEQSTDEQIINVSILFIEKCSKFENIFPLFETTNTLFNLARKFRILSLHFQESTLNIFINIALSNNFEILFENNIPKLMFSWCETSIPRIITERSIIIKILQISNILFEKSEIIVEDLLSSSVPQLFQNIFDNIGYSEDFDIIFDFYMNLYRFEQSEEYVELIDISNFFSTIFLCGKDLITKLLRFINDNLAEFPNIIQEYLHSDEFIENIQDILDNKDLSEETHTLAQIIIESVTE